MGMKSFLTALAVAAICLGAPAYAQLGGVSAPGQGPLDVSARDFEAFDQENRIVYLGDVNATRGTSRLRADRIEVFFEPRGSSAGRGVTRMIATGNVYYVTPTEVAHSSAATYDVAANLITMTGNVVLTQGCNVSTGDRLTANLTTGVSQLGANADSSSGGRVRSIFFPDEEGAEDTPQADRDCPAPTVPGDGPIAFEGR